MAQTSTTPAQWTFLTLLSLLTTGWQAFVIDYFLGSTPKKLVKSEQKIVDIMLPFEQ